MAPMRLHILSDLHLEFGDFTPEPVEADVVVLAGDIWHRARGIVWAAEQFVPERTLYILGNHEFYGEEFADVGASCRRVAAASGVHFLESDVVVIDGVRFLGAALWSDFRLFGEARRADAMYDAAAMMNDFHLVSI